MPTTLTGTASYSTTVDGPSSGETATSAAMRASLQTLINNTAYFKQVVESTGIQKIKSVAGSAALKALAGVSNNDVVFDTTNCRLYRRNTGSSGSDSESIYFDHDTEAGGWDLIRPPRQTVNWGVTTGVALYSTNSATFSDVTGASVTLAGARAGDHVLVRCHATTDTNGDALIARIRVTDGASTNNDLTSQQSFVQDDTAANAQTIPILGYHSLAADGTVVVQIRAAALSGGTTVDIQVRYLEVEIIRP